MNRAWPCHAAVHPSPQSVSNDNLIFKFTKSKSNYQMTKDLCLSGHYFVFYHTLTRYCVPNTLVTLFICHSHPELIQNNNPHSEAQHKSKTIPNHSHAYMLAKDRQYTNYKSMLVSMYELMRPMRELSLGEGEHHKPKNNQRPNGGETAFTDA